METEALFGALATPMVDEDPTVERARVMHSIGLKTAGKFFAFVRKRELVMKVPAGRACEPIADATGRPFDAGKGPPMKNVYFCSRVSTLPAPHSSPRHSPSSRGPSLMAMLTD